MNPYLTQDRNSVRFPVPWRMNHDHLKAMVFGLSRISLGMQLMFALSLFPLVGLVELRFKADTGVEYLSGCGQHHFVLSKHRNREVVALGRGTRTLPHIHMCGSWKSVCEVHGDLAPSLGIYVASYVSAFRQCVHVFVTWAAKSCQDVHSVHD